MRVPRTRIILYGLFAIDAIFIALAVLHARGVLMNPRFSLSRERSFSEMFQYVQYATASVFLFYRASRHGGVTLLLWGALFAFLMLDDAFQIHERAGMRISTIEGLPSIGRMRPNQLGEVIYAATEGVVFFIALGWSLRSADANSRALTVALLAGLALLALCGVILDAVDSLLRGSLLALPVSFLEDGGEMIAASVLAWTAWAWTPRPGAS